MAAKGKAGQAARAAASKASIASKAGSSSSSSSTKSTTTSTPSVPSGGRVVAGRIYDSGGKYVGMASTGTSSTTSTPAPITYTFTNPTTGKTQTVTAAQLATFSPATRSALASQMQSGSIQGTSGGKAIGATQLTNTPAQTPTIPTKPTVVQPTISAKGKTISQDAYDAFVQQAKKQGKTDEEITSALTKSGLSIAPTTQIESNKPGDVLLSKQNITAPNGKVYEVTVDKSGKASFQSQGGLGSRTFNSLAEAVNTINTGNPATTTPEEKPEVDRLKEGESDIQGLDELTKFAQEMNDQYLQTALDAKNQVQQYIDSLAVTNQETANALDSVINDRFKAMNDNFAAISKSITDLETKANDLFDVNAMIARQQRAKQLAESGILTSEQAGSAAQYSLQDYTMNVELKRAELMQQAQEAMTNALKEKAILQDQILQQEGIDAVTKQNMVQQVNTMYQNMINGYADRVNQANSQYDQAIQNARGKQVEVDIQRKLPLIQEEAAKELNATQKASANSDPQYRYEYVLNKFGEIDANLKSFVTGLMNKYKNNGTFMSKDIDAFISELAGKALSSYKSYNTVSTGTPTGTPQTPQVPAGTPTTPAGGDTETWMPSTVGMSFGYTPKVTYNPLTMSGTPMQSTVGGA